MKKKSVMVILLLSCLLLFGCTQTPAENPKNHDGDKAIPGDTDFRVETFFERHEDIADQYKLDVRIPMVSPLVANAEQINDVIFTDFADILNLPEGQFLSDTGWEYPIYNVDYQMSNINGICALNIVASLSSGLGSDISSTLHSYYYDENTGEILQKDTYLSALDYTQEEIEKAFNDKMKETLGGEFSYSEITWYFDQNNQLQFIMNYD